MLEPGQSRKTAAIITSVCVRFFYVGDFMNQFFEEALKEADKAYRKSEVPIGAVIVFNNKIIAKAYNKRVKSKDVTSHAEIIAIRKAAKKIGDWRLNGCSLYVTLEPCDMCKEVIKESRIDSIYYLVKKYDYKKSFDKTSMNLVEEDSFQQKVSEYKDKLSTFFKLKCNRQ